MVQYWRQSGLNYVAYANTCAKMVRAVLKPDVRRKVAERDMVQFNFSKYTGGKAEPSQQITRNVEDALLADVPK